MEAEGLPGVGMDAIDSDGAGSRWDDLGGGMVGVDLPFAGDGLLKDEGLDFGGAVVEQEVLLTDGYDAGLNHAVFGFLLIVVGGPGVFDVADCRVLEGGGFFVGVVLGGVGKNATVFVDVDFFGVEVGGDGV